jgi:hypothetical protein
MSALRNNRSLSRIGLDLYRRRTQSQNSNPVQTQSNSFNPQWIQNMSLPQLTQLSNNPYVNDFFNGFSFP